jgi:hypothetical protein
VAEVAVPIAPTPVVADEATIARGRTARGNEDGAGRLGWHAARGTAAAGGGHRNHCRCERDECEQTDEETAAWGSTSSGHGGHGARGT